MKKLKNPIGTDFVPYDDDDDTSMEDFENEQTITPLIDLMKRDLIHIKGQVELHNYSTPSGRLLAEYIEKYIYTAENL